MKDKSAWDEEDVNAVGRDQSKLHVVHYPNGLQLKLLSSFLALLPTLVAGWAFLKGYGFALFCLGIVGTIAMILIEGVHGGSHLENMIGGAVFVSVNVIFYYFVFQWVLAKLLKLDLGNVANKRRSDVPFIRVHRQRTRLLSPGAKSPPNRLMV